MCGLAGAHRIISDTYGKTLAIGDRTCQWEWFQRFKSGEFAVEDRHGGGGGKVVEDAELEASDSQMIEKERHWVPHELKPRDVEGRLVACEQLMERQTGKRFLHCIVTGDEKWVHYNKPGAENHGDCPMVILLRQHLGRISMVQKSCFAFGEGTSLA
nr:Mariner Mos1 transposase [Hymenolepis microstoma]